MTRSPRQVQQPELLHVSRNYLKVGSALNTEKQPKRLARISKTETGLITAIPVARGRAADSIQILIDLQAERLKVESDAVSRRNAGIASVLGGLMLRDEYQRAENRKRIFSHKEIGALSLLALNLFENVSEVVDGLASDDEIINTPKLAIHMSRLGELLFKSGSKPYFQLEDGIIRRYGN